MDLVKALAVFLVACGGAVDPVQDAAVGEDAPVAHDIVDAAPRGTICVTDPINGAGFVPDGGCDPSMPCQSEDGSVGQCK